MLHAAKYRKMQKMQSSRDLCETSWRSIYSSIIMNLFRAPWHEETICIEGVITDWSDTENTGTCVFRRADVWYVLTGVLNEKGQLGICSCAVKLRLDAALLGIPTLLPLAIRRQKRQLSERKHECCLLFSKAYRPWNEPWRNYQCL